LQWGLGSQLYKFLFSSTNLGFLPLLFLNKDGAEICESVHMEIRALHVYFGAV